MHTTLGVCSTQVNYTALTAYSLGVKTYNEESYQQNDNKCYGKHIESLSSAALTFSLSLSIRFDSLLSTRSDFLSVLILFGMARFSFLCW